MTWHGVGYCTYFWRLSTDIYLPLSQAQISFQEDLQDLMVIIRDGQMYFVILSECTCIKWVIGLEYYELQKRLHVPGRGYTAIHHHLAFARTCHFRTTWSVFNLPPSIKSVEGTESHHLFLVSSLVFCFLASMQTCFAVRGRAFPRMPPFQETWKASGERHRDTILISLTQ